MDKLKKILAVLSVIGCALSMSAYAEGCRIMAAGDQSVFEVAGTQENPSHGMVGVRLPIQASLASLGLTCDWVGDKVIGHNDGPSDGITFDPDMVGGGRIFADVLGGIIGAQVAKYQPHIVIVGVGVYDPLSQMVRNGSNMTLQPGWLAAFDVVHVIDVVHETDPMAKVVLLVPVTGINHYAPLEELRTNILSLMITRTFADVIDTGRLLDAPNDYVALELMNTSAAKKVADALLTVIRPTIEVLVAPTPVPVPAAFWLLGSAILAATMMRRTRA